MYVLWWQFIHHFICLCVSVPTEAYAFLGAVAAFLLLLILFFCYLHKKLCFSECGGFPCCDEPPKKEKTSKLGKKRYFTSYNSTIL